MLLNARNGEVPTVPTGGSDWTFIGNSPTTSNNGTSSTTSLSQIFVYYCIRGASAPSLAVTRGTGPDLCSYNIHVWRPQTGYTFEHVLSSFESDGSPATSANHTHASITTDHADSLVCHWIGMGANNGADTFTAATDPTDVSSGSTATTGVIAANEWERRGNSGSNGLLDGGMSCAVTIKGTAGATGTLSATLSGTRRASSWAGVFRQKQYIFTLAADTAGFTEGATAATLLHHKRVAADAAAYAVDGTSVDLIAPVRVLQDSFATLDTANTWNETDIGGYINIVSGELAIDAVTDYPFIASKLYFNLLATAMTVKVAGLVPTSGTAGRQFVWTFEGSGASQYAGFLIDHTNSLIAYYQDGGSLTYPASVTLTGATVLRIREDSGTLYWEYSTTGGSSWTTLYSLASFSWLGKGRIVFYSGHWNGGETPIRASRWDDLNILSVVYTLACDPAAYAVSEQAATLLHHKRIAADTAAYVVAGTAATPLHHKRIAADTAAYAVAGTDATLTFIRKITADTAAYTVAGTAASLLYHRRLTADVATYLVGGTAATLLHHKRIAADTAAYLVAAQDATLTYVPLGSYSLTCDPAAYAIAGTAASLLWHHRITADVAAYLVTGTAATLTYVPITIRTLTADPAAYLVSGTPALLTKLGLEPDPAPGGGGGGTGNWRVRRKGKRPRYLHEIEEEAQREAEEARRALVEEVPEPPYIGEPGSFGDVLEDISPQQIPKSWESQELDYTNEGPLRLRHKALQQAARAEAMAAAREAIEERRRAIAAAAKHKRELEEDDDDVLMFLL